MASSQGYVAENGYRRVWVAGEGERYEHRVVMEQSLGRPLERLEHVHHRNGDKLDNRLENLEVLSKSAHHRHHAVRTPPRACDVCGQLAKPLRRGRCNACNCYLRRTGRERSLAA